MTKMSFRFCASIFCVILISSVLENNVEVPSFQVVVAEERDESSISSSVPKVARAVPTKKSTKKVFSNENSSAKSIRDAKKFPNKQTNVPKWQKAYNTCIEPCQQITRHLATGWAEYDSVLLVETSFGRVWHCCQEGSIFIFAGCYFLFF